MIGAAPAKVNLALVVGPPRPDAKHEVLTLLQRVSLADEVELEPAERTVVDGFDGDTIVADALARLAKATDHEGGWAVRIEKRIPIAAGLGGGSSDAATALRLANATLPEPLPPARLHALAAAVGADCPFFLEPGPALASGDGSTLQPVALPTDFALVLLAPHGETKRSTGEVYRRFDARAGEEGYEGRAQSLRAALAAVRTAADLAALPPNDLAGSDLSRELIAAGAFRADVSGAGPTLYGLFHDRSSAEAAAPSLARLGQVWVVEPSWYG